MRIWLEERIGNPELFTGRKKELAYFLNWTDRIKRKISQSTAVLSRRKTGKTALLQRLFNTVFEKNDRVIPFYYEIREADRWLGDFAEDFFLTFIYQYIAFKTRNRDYLLPGRTRTLEDAYEVSGREGLDYLKDPIRGMQVRDEREQADMMWDIARESPRGIAERNDERVVQMIDEFQFINRFVFWDKEKTRQAKKLSASYLHTCEYRMGAVFF